MKGKIFLGLFFVLFIALSSAETVYYNNYNGEVISTYSVIHNNYEGFDRIIRITDVYKNLNDYYYYSDSKSSVGYRDCDRGRNCKYYENYEKDDNISYYIYKSKFLDKTKKVRCYNEAPEGKLFYTKCP